MGEGSTLNINVYKYTCYGYLEEGHWEKDVGSSGQTHTMYIDNDILYLRDSSSFTPIDMSDLTLITSSSFCFRKEVCWGDKSIPDVQCSITEEENEDDDSDWYITITRFNC